MTMHYLETVHTDGNHYRIEWNGSATFNIQIPVGGQWVDVECFTCYDIDGESEAFNYAIDWMLENIGEEEGEDV